LIQDSDLAGAEILTDISSLFTVPIGDLILWFVVFLFSLSFHEMAHAWTSERFGDDTGRLQGRISLNPLVHIDPIGTILFPLLGFMRGGISFFGWAKPVQTNPLRWRNKTQANIAVSAAGPISNFILVIVVFVIMKALLSTGVMMPALTGTGPFDLVMPTSDQAGLMVPMAKLLSIFLILNLALGVFNLIPVPPLDGSHILESLLPPGLAEVYAQLRPYGFLLLIVLVWLGVFSTIYLPVFKVVLTLLFF
jgi:Zn-dependent protease